MSRPAKRRCRFCGQEDGPGPLIEEQHPAKSGWCGGPRQGGRTTYRHDACQDEFEARNQATREAELERLRAEIEAMRAEKTNEENRKAK